MANAIPQQLVFKKGAFKSDRNKDTIKKKREIVNLLQHYLGEGFEHINYVPGSRIVYGKYTKKDGKVVYLQVANLTFMGGKEGQHPADLKRIQYNLRWRKFYYKYHKVEGDVLWLGLYSYNDINVWAFFRPETYLAKHEGKSMKTKSGIMSNYSCHIFLNDIKQGIEQGKTGGYFSKIDVRGNEVGAVSKDNLKKFLDNEANCENSILSVINSINRDVIPWDGFVTAQTAITEMYDMSKSPIGFNNWKQTMWNGWYIEALYSEHLYNHPSDYIHYIATTKNKEVKNEYANYNLDLAFPYGENRFIGDLKAVSFNSDKFPKCRKNEENTPQIEEIVNKYNTFLNDKDAVNNAIKQFKRIWFIIYLHDKKPGSTRRSEMVKWRNNFIKEKGEWDKNKEFNELSAPRTPHSVHYKRMVVVELNELNKDKYFKLKGQGKNTNGKPRPQKYSISKLILNITNDDGLVIARYEP